MSNSPQDKTSGVNSSQSDVQFTTSNIGRWASKQENPFAEQNRKTAAKKQARDAKRQKTKPVAVAAISILAVAAAIWGLVVLIISLINRPESQTPVIAGTSSEDITEYRDKLMNFYNQRPDASSEDRLQDVKDAVDRTLNTANGKKYADQVRLAQIGFYVVNGNYIEATDLENDINPDNLDIREQSNYYNMLAYCYELLGESGKAHEYSVLAYELTNQLEESTGD